jgi:phosphoribosylamine--glycine ligase
MNDLTANKARVLIIGSGGREHAIGIQLEADGVDKVFFAPGNGGTVAIGDNVPLDPNDFQAIHEFVKKAKVNLIVVGPEDPLANGIVDFFRALKIPIIGPTQAAAQIESSKIFARNLMTQANVPQPEFIVCKNRDDAEQAIALFELPVVLKVSCLAAGKGAFVCKTSTDLEEALKAIYDDNKFGPGSILVEECLFGQEMSVFVLCNGPSHLIIGTAQDYKCLLDGDEGPNTGGMGSISPSPLVAIYPDLMEKVEERVIKPTLQAMRNNLTPFTGFLYAGLMIVDGDPFVIEFNCRLGDPETQVVLPLISNNFFDLLWGSVNNADLGNHILEPYNLAAAFVVKVAGGYPNKYRKGDTIEIEADASFGCDIIHAGTKCDDSMELITNGGRVIGALALGQDLKEAVDIAYDGIDQIHFADEFCRRDIGKF